MEMTIAEKMALARANEIDACRKDVEHFIDKWGHIEDKHNTSNIIQPFKMWEAQRNALRSIKDHKLNAILKARQLGFLGWFCTMLHGNFSALKEAQ